MAKDTVGERDEINDHIPAHIAVNHQQGLMRWRTTKLLNPQKQVSGLLCVTGVKWDDYLHHGIRDGGTCGTGCAKAISAFWSSAIAMERTCSGVRCITAT